MDHQTLGKWDNQPSDPVYYIEDCRISCQYPIINYPDCFQVPKEVCHDVPKKISKEHCIKVPKTNCHEIPIKIPKKVPRKVCKDIPKQHCKDVPIKKPKKVPIIILSITYCKISSSNMFRLVTCLINKDRKSDDFLNRSSTSKYKSLFLNTSYLTDSGIVFTLKMESVWQFLV